MRQYETGSLLNPLWLALNIGQYGFGVGVAFLGRFLFMYFFLLWGIIPMVVTKVGRIAE